MRTFQVVHEILPAEASVTIGELLGLGKPARQPVTQWEATLQRVTQASRTPAATERPLLRRVWVDLETGERHEEPEPRAVGEQADGLLRVQWVDLHSGAPVDPPEGHRIRIPL